VKLDGDEYTGVFLLFIQ